MLAQLDVLKISYSTDLLEIIDATDIESFDIKQDHLFGKTTAAYMMHNLLTSRHRVELFSLLQLVEAHPLRFGSFATLRHSTLDFLAWSRPTGDIRLTDSINGVVHYAIKLVADVHLLERKDIILSSTVVRQETLEALSLTRTKDFSCSNGSLDSESQLDHSAKKQYNMPRLRDRESR